MQNYARQRKGSKQARRKLMYTASPACQWYMTRRFGQRKYYKVYNILRLLEAMQRLCALRVIPADCTVSTQEYYPSQREKRKGPLAKKIMATSAELRLLYGRRLKMDLHPLPKREAMGGEEPEVNFFLASYLRHLELRADNACDLYRSMIDDAQHTTFVCPAWSYLGNVLFRSLKVEITPCNLLAVTLMD